MELGGQEALHHAGEAPRSSEYRVVVPVCFRDDERCLVTTYVRWFPDDADLLDMTAIKARDLVVKCFYEAQKETIAAAGRKIGQAQSDAELENIVVGAVRLAFRKATGDFDHPTKGSLLAAVRILAHKSQQWGTPRDIVDHHKAQIEESCKS